MNKLLHDLILAPNLLSLVRLIMVPILISLALNDKANWFLLGLVFSVTTDVLDGYIARHLNLITELGARLDRLGDFAIYSSITVCAWILWPQIVKQEIIFIGVIFISFTLPALIGLIKFKTITSYHTISVKIAVAFTLISYVIMFAGFSAWPFRIASFLCVYAGLEEIAISLVLKHERVDVLSFKQALKYRTRDRDQDST
jgi:cardiolipin synthase